MGWHVCDLADERAQMRSGLSVSWLTKVRKYGDKGALRFGKGMVGGERYICERVSEFIGINRH